MRNFSVWVQYVISATSPASCNTATCILRRVNTPAVTARDRPLKHHMVNYITLTQYDVEYLSGLLLDKLTHLKCYNDKVQLMEKKSLSCLGYMTRNFKASENWRLQIFIPPPVKQCVFPSCSYWWILSLAMYVHSLTLEGGFTFIAQSVCCLCVNGRSEASPWLCFVTSQIVRKPTLVQYSTYTSGMTRRRHFVSSITNTAIFM